MGKTLYHRRSVPGALCLAAAALFIFRPLFAETLPPAEPAALQPADRANGLGFKFYARAGETKGNMVFSPYGLYSAVSLVYDCAREGTAAEMRGAFTFPEDRDLLRTETVQQRWGLIKAVKGSEFGRVNAFWFQKGYEVAAEYEGVLKSSYSASAETADFRSSAERARTAVNTWTEKQTGGRIPFFFEQGAVTQLTRLMLVNALYFKGKFKVAFSTGATTEQDFTLDGGEKVKTQLMASVRPVKINYYEDTELQAAGLDYAGGKLRLVVIMPAEGKSAAETGKALTPEKLAELRKGLSTRLEPALIYLPRFKLSGAWNLAVELAALGMPQAFTETADFSGMMGRKGLYLQKAAQKVFVEVDEAGAIAAAAPKKRGKKPLVFRADRPFIFLVEEKRTGLILFMGRLEDPSLADL